MTQTPGDSAKDRSSDMRFLQIGATGPDVLFAQRLYNNAPSNVQGVPNLVEDGIFGLRTLAAIRTFQTRRTPAIGLGGTIQPATQTLRQDGAIDDPTWLALGAGPSCEHNVKLVWQYSDNSCWHACMDMILGGGQCRNMPLGVVITSGAGQGGLTDSLRAITIYARALGGRAVRAPSTAGELCALIQSRPGVLLGRSVRFQYGHAVVLSGYFNDAPRDDLSTIIRIHNPAPPYNGAIEGSVYPSMSLSGGSFAPEWVIAR
jgi:Papain-like cysteine protease AvrRpt2